jgi:UDP-N-acetylglucosamine 2-epimerase (non-hydrolysing)/GDP/UDP-N,N'-diacetylbacillosamine 2-epimerase (hydrolysing)
MRSIFRAIEASDSLELGLIVTGMHLLFEYGLSVREIERDGFQILHRLSMPLGEDTGLAMAKSLGTAILRIADALDEIQPNIILLQGDRGEMLAAAIVSAHANIPIVHMSGGDYSGSIDDSIRHAITKLAHLHLVTCEQSAQRVKAMGEASERVFVVGEPSLDAISSLEPVPPKQLAEQFDLDLARPLILATQHPVTSEADHAAKQIHETLEALVELGEQAIITYPNSDAGGRAMIQVIEDYKRHSFLRFSCNASHDTYLSMMKIASVMVGNSSSGIIEAPSFRLPVVNVGTRQIGRLRAANVIDVGYKRKEIVLAIQKALHDQEFRESLRYCVNPYGDGHTSERTVKILERIRFVPELIAKWMPPTYFLE